jgi:hypothetical protein
MDGLRWYEKFEFETVFQFIEGASGKVIDESWITQREW